MSDKPYQPSTDTEGMIFAEKYCNQCKHIGNGTGKNDCPIADGIFWKKPSDPDYPKELIYDSSGNGKCTAFEKEVNGE